MVLASQFWWPVCRWQPMRPGSRAGLKNTCLRRGAVGCARLRYTAGSTLQGIALEDFSYLLTKLLTVANSSHFAELSGEAWFRIEASGCERILIRSFESGLGLRV